MQSMLSEVCNFAFIKTYLFIIFDEVTDFAELAEEAGVDNIRNIFVLIFLKAAQH